MRPPSPAQPSMEPAANNVLDTVKAAIKRAAASHPRCAAFVAGADNLRFSSDPLSPETAQPLCAAIAAKTLAAARAMGKVPGAKKLSVASILHAGRSKPVANIQIELPWCPSHAAPLDAPALAGADPSWQQVDADTAAGGEVFFRTLRCRLRVLTGPLYFAGGEAWPPARPTHPR